MTSKTMPVMADMTTHYRGNDWGHQGYACPGVVRNQSRATTVTAGCTVYDESGSNDADDQNMYRIGHSQGRQVIKGDERSFFSEMGCE
jgi:hypothetical protein